MKLAQAERQARLQVLKRLHFRLCDPKYRLPSRDEFEDFVASLETGEWTKDEGMDLDGFEALVKGE